MLNKFQYDPNAWSRLLTSLALAGFLAIAGFFLFTEHRAHLYGALPYLLIFVCLGFLLVVWHLAKPSTPTSGVSDRSKKGETSHES